MTALDPTQSALTLEVLIAMANKDDEKKKHVEEK